jgi:hypothetical protein
VAIQQQESLGDTARWGREELREVRGDFSGIVDDLRLIAQKEVELARAEMREQFGITTQSLIYGAVTGVLAMLLLTFTFVTVMLVLDTFMPLWAAALVTTLIVGGLAALTGMMAYSMFKRISVVPKRTMDSINEDVKWAKRQMSFSAR